MSDILRRAETIQYLHSLTLVKVVELPHQLMIRFVNSYRE